MLSNHCSVRHSKRDERAKIYTVGISTTLVQPPPKRALLAHHERSNTPMGCQDNQCLRLSGCNKYDDSYGTIGSKGILP